MITHPTELDLIHFIHQFRTHALDAFFLFLNFFDRQEFFFILIPVLWMGHGWKKGLKVFYILLLSYLVNHGLKEFFASPRPFHLDPSVGLIHIREYGFPSGAAQTAMLLSGLLLFYWKNPWKWLVIIPYILLISFSRIYLGVHFPTDILAGWTVGLILFAIIIYLLPLIEKRLHKLSPFSLFCLSQLIPILLLLFLNSSTIILLASIAMGLGIGVLISYSYRILPSLPKTPKKYAIEVSVAVIGAFLCYGLTSMIPGAHSSLGLFFRALFIALWLSLGCHFLFFKFFRKVH